MNFQSVENEVYPKVTLGSYEWRQHSLGKNFAKLGFKKEIKLGLVIVLHASCEELSNVPYIFVGNFQIYNSVYVHWRSRKFALKWKIL